MVSIAPRQIVRIAIGIAIVWAFSTTAVDAAGRVLLVATDGSEVRERISIADPASSSAATPNAGRLLSSGARPGIGTPPGPRPASP